MTREKFDEALIARQLSDPAQRNQAFNALVRNLSPKIYWQIRRLVFSHDDANDIMQDTFVKVWKNIENFRGDSKVSTWIFRIAINEALNFLQHRHDDISLDSSPEASVASQLAADEYFDGDEAQLRFQAAIASLPPKQRIVFNLRYFDNMKYEEMSRQLGTSEGALKASYHIAVEKITAKLKDTE